MATGKKHIAVYLDKAVEDALTEFCVVNGMESKKGPMYSAAVNKALAQFFEINNNIPSDIPSDIPSTTLDNIPSDIPSTTLDNIPSTTLAQHLAELETQVCERFAAIEERLGKLRA